MDEHDLGGNEHVTALIMLLAALDIVRIERFNGNGNTSSSPRVCSPPDTRMVFYKTLSGFMWYVK